MILLIEIWIANRENDCDLDWDWEKQWEFVDICKLPVYRFTYISMILLSV